MKKQIFWEFPARPAATFPSYRYDDTPRDVCRAVAVSDRAYRAILAEVFSHGDNETGGVFLGHFHQGIWYLVDVVDPGIKDTINSRSYFQYDIPYANHLAGALKRIYRYPPGILGFYHRHPGSMDTFSGTDLDTIDDHVQDSRCGILTMLVNMDPSLRMTFYYAGKDRVLTRVPYTVGDDAFPEEILALAEPEELFARAQPKRPWIGLRPWDKELLAGKLPRRLFPGHFQSPGAASREEAAPAEETPAEKSPTEAAAVSPSGGERPQPKNTVSIPQALLDHILQDGFRGSFYGYLRPETGAHAILGWTGAEPDPALGASVIGGFGPVDRGIRALQDEEGLSFFYLDGEAAPIPLTAEPYSLVQNLFSRQSGLMETDWNLNTTVVLTGCGSVGSVAALELAREGVGRFLLCDPDVLEIHNICRHQLGLESLGRYKVEALRERILRINPTASVTVFPGIIQNLPQSLLVDCIGDRPAVFLGCGDNRLGNAFANDLAYDFQRPFVSIGFWSRAGVLECFRWLPGRKMTRYRCAFREAVEAAAVERNRFYLDQADEAKVHFEPGIDVDITLGTSIGVKVVLDLLNLENASYTPRLLPYTGQLLLFANSHLEQVAGEDAAKLFTHPLQAARGLSMAPCDCDYCQERVAPQTQGVPEVYSLGDRTFETYEDMMAAMQQETLAGTEAEAAVDAIQAEAEAMLQQAIAESSAPCGQ